MINLDADPESADWTKNSWDLPPYMSKEFFDYMGPNFDLEHFKTTPVYLNAVNNLLIHDDEWVADSCGPAAKTGKETSQNTAR